MILIDDKKSSKAVISHFVALLHNLEVIAQYRHMVTFIVSASILLIVLTPIIIFLIKILKRLTFRVFILLLNS